MVVPVHFCRLADVLENRQDTAHLRRLRMRRDFAWLLKRMAASLVLVVVAVSCSPAAEGKKPSPNHPPGFVKPEPTEVIQLWPGDAPGLVSGGKLESFENERYRNVSSPQLFVYLPAKEKARGTALIIAPWRWIRPLSHVLAR